MCGYTSGLSNIGCSRHEIYVVVDLFSYYLTMLRSLSSCTEGRIMYNIYVQSHYEGNDCHTIPKANLKIEIVCSHIMLLLRCDFGSFTHFKFIRHILCL